MQNTLSFLPVGLADAEPNSVFNVVIAYEDFETGKQAKRTYDYLAENLGQGSVFSNQMWKFEVLSIPKLREMAVQDALAADIIIVACHGNHELPTEVKVWIESWLCEPRRPLALVGLFDAEQSESVRDYLADVAKRGGMEFFAQADSWSEQSSAHDIFPYHLAQSQSSRTFSTVAASAPRDGGLSHWGINE